MKQFIVNLLFMIISASSFADNKSHELKVEIGEKLFLDDRFSKSFFINNADLNTKTSSGDPNLDINYMEFPMGLHPEKGKHFSCATCHMVDQASSENFNLVFTYNDNFIFSPTPFVTKPKGHTLRNSSNLVGVLKNKNNPLHWDGEFFSGHELSCHSLTGPNMGWDLSEHRTAVQHIANVIINDNGTYPISDLANSYYKSFLDLGINITKINKHKVFHLACDFISSYMQDIDFAKDENNTYNGSAFDKFLATNNILTTNGEAPAAYRNYLNKQLRRSNLKFIKASPLKNHKSSSKFESLELQGLKIFAGRGQCIKCHTPPLFTDNSFHNIGVSQLDYEKIHGIGSIFKVKVPTYKLKVELPHKYNFATFRNPKWASPYRESPSLLKPKYIDLGLWNNFGHPDKAHHQNRLKSEICKSQGLNKSCNEKTNQDLLELSFALFKTPSLRSLGQSQPYFHNGSSPTLAKAVNHYVKIFKRAHNNEIKNSSPILSKIRLDRHDTSALVAFLNSLNEDYE